MATLTKNSLINEVTEKAKKESSRRRLDEFDTDDLIHEAKEIIEDIFNSVIWEDYEPDRKSRGPISSWHHRDYVEIEMAWKCLRINRAGLRNAAEKYLERPWLHSKSIDWLFLNLLTYAECLATMDFVRANCMPLSRYIAMGSDSASLTTVSILWRTLTFLLKWAIWILIFAVSFLIAPYGPIIWLGITVWFIWRKMSATKKAQEVLSSMFATYACFSTISQSWSIVWEELNKSREKGAVWDGVVYRLVEMRKLQCP